MLQKRRAARIGFVAVLVAVGLCGSQRSLSSPATVWAQVAPQSAASATPLPHVPILIPIAPPKGWDARAWARQRAECQAVVDKGHAGIPLTQGEFRELEVCETVQPYPSSATHEPPSSSPPEGHAVPLPTATVQPESSLSDPSNNTPADHTGSRLRLIRRMRVLRVRANLPTSLRTCRPRKSSRC